MLQRSEARRGMKVAPPAFKAGLTRQIGKLQSAGRSRPGFVRCGSSKRTVSDDGYLWAKGR